MDGDWDIPRKSWFIPRPRCFFCADKGKDDVLLGDGDAFGVKSRCWETCFDAAHFFGKANASGAKHEPPYPCFTKKDYVTHDRAC